jgi:RNA polymerase sigma factor for flagellar operon FliA
MAGNDKREGAERPGHPNALGDLSPEHVRVIEAMPLAMRWARTTARIYGVRVRAIIEDCEQTACEALLLGQPRYDPERGPFDIFIWKRVVGAVTKLLRRELAQQRTGFNEALDAADEVRRASDPFEDEDGDVLASLKEDCRYVAFRRFMGDHRAPQPNRLDDMLLRVEAFDALASAFGGLSKDEKRFLALRYWEGLSFPQIAEAMGETERQAKRIDQRLRERLRRDLRRKGLEQAPPSAPP